MGCCLIRDISTADEDVIFSLMKANMHHYYESRKERWNEENLRRFFMSKSACVMFQDDVLIGVSFYETHHNSLHIHTLQVASSHQHKWVGYAFFKWYLKKAYELGVHFIDCGVYEINPALAIYLRLGFAEVSRENGIIKLSFSVEDDRSSNVFFRAISRVDVQESGRLC